MKKLNYEYNTRVLVYYVSSGCFVCFVVLVFVRSKLFNRRAQFNIQYSIFNIQNYKIIKNYKHDENMLMLQHIIVPV